MVPVILSGGAGTRLWPLSRRERPKQLIPLLGESSLLQRTARRAAAVDGAAAAVVVTGAAHHEVIGRQLADVGLAAARIVVEPVGRNTAPAAAAAALLADPGELLLVLPSDHLIRDVPAFTAAVARAARAAAQGYLVTFGVVPTRPETGFGYIERGADLGDGALEVRAFVEKPDRGIAESYLASGRHFWNSGMFLFRAGRYLEELELHAPDILEAVRGAIGPEDGHGRVFLTAAEFGACRADSIDYAVMEPTGRAAMVPLDAGWHDVGSWEAVWELEDRDASGNAVSGSAYLEQVRRSLVLAGDRPVAVIGLDDVIVVDAGDAVLVCARDHAQAVREIVARLEADGRAEVERPTA